MRNSLEPKTYEEALHRRLARQKAKPRPADQKERQHGYEWRKAKRPLGYSGRRTLRTKPDRKLQIWSRKVRERDDYTCQKCGRRDPGIVIAHHIAPRSRRRDLKYELSNGVTLCEIPCHQWVHSNPIESTAAGLLSTATYEAAQKARKAA